ncbi:ABC transporter permease [Cohnella fermenti]|uniref:ABC transporter permease n=1 Tax=Cohnella fermenti TaxID=2565925 RepID=UPI001454DFFD|nr:ABC transporter permease [Cohnella fermenti]
MDAERKATVGGGRLEELRRLRASRAQAFRREIAAHSRYVFQSGFGLVVSALGITLVMGYIRTLKDMPADWPADLVGWIVLALLCLYTPLRTYLQPSDTVFVLPLEEGMLSGILRPLVRRAMLMSAVRVLVAFGSFVPLYQLAPITEGAADSRSPWALALALAGAAVWNVHAAWTERRMADTAWRIGLLLMRWIASVAIVAALLLKSFGLALGFTALIVAVWYLLSRLVPKHTLPWDRLIAEEGAARRRWNRFLGWFVDLPTEFARPARRRWIAWTVDRLAWKRGNAWRYLYAKTMLRSETFGALWRWSVLLMLVLLFSGHPIVDLIAFVIAVLVGGLQITELGRVRFAENASVVPLAQDERGRSIASIARIGGVLLVALLWLVASLPNWPFSPVLWGAALIAALFWAGWLLPRRVTKSFDADED